MNHASQWRIELARSIAPHYARYPHVDAVVLLGGAARGWADSWSDIDLVVYWQQPPTDAERYTVIEALNAEPGNFGDTFTEQPDPNLRCWFEDFYLAGDPDTGFKIDVGHHLTSDMDAVVEAVTQRYDTHALKQEMLYSIKRVLPFYGETRIECWKRAAGLCPEPLARRFVEKNLRLPEFWIAEASAARGDWLLYQRAALEVCRSLLAAVVALNREYFPGTKHQAHLLADMTIRPEHFNTRLIDCLRGEPEAAIAEIYRLYDEVYALAQQHMPTADLTGAREEFFHRRARWDSPPVTLR